MTQIAALPVLVTSYERLLAEPLGWCEEVGSFLARAGLLAGGPNEAEVLGFVDARLRHVELGHERLLADAAVSRPQRELFFALERLSGVHESFAMPELPAETPTGDAILADRRRALEREVDGVGGRLARGARRLARLFS